MGEPRYRCTDFNCRQTEYRTDAIRSHDRNAHVNPTAGRALLGNFEDRSNQLKVRRHPNTLGLQDHALCKFTTPSKSYFR